MTNMQGVRVFLMPCFILRKDVREMTQKEINKQYAEVERLYEKAKQIAVIAIQMMKDANSRLRELNKELERVDDE